MKVFNGIMSVLLGIVALYLMFTAQNNQDITIGIGALLMAIIFMCFLIMEEQKREIEGLKRILLHKYK